MSLSTARPIEASSHSRRLVRTISPPPAWRVIIRRVIAWVMSPVEEDADDVHAQRRQQGEGGRNVHEQPGFQKSRDVDLPPRQRQGVGLALQQVDDLAQ